MQSDVDAKPGSGVYPAISADFEDIDGGDVSNHSVTSSATVKGETIETLGQKRDTDLSREHAPFDGCSERGAMAVAAVEACAEGVNQVEESGRLAGATVLAAAEVADETASITVVVEEGEEGKGVEKTVEETTPASRSNEESKPSCTHASFHGRADLGAVASTSTRAVAVAEGGGMAGEAATSAALAAASVVEKRPAVVEEVMVATESRAATTPAVAEAAATAAPERQAAVMAEETAAVTVATHGEEAKAKENPETEAKVVAGEAEALAAEARATAAETRAVATAAAAVAATTAAAEAAAARTEAVVAAATAAAAVEAAGAELTSKQKALTAALIGVSEARTVAVQTRASVAERRAAAAGVTVATAEAREAAAEVNTTAEREVAAGAAEVEVVTREAFEEVAAATAKAERKAELQYRSCSILAQMAHRQCNRNKLVAFMRFRSAVSAVAVEGPAVAVAEAAAAKHRTVTEQIDDDLAVVETVAAANAEKVASKAVAEAVAAPVSAAAAGSIKEAEEKAGAAAAATATEAASTAAAAAATTAAVLAAASRRVEDAERAMKEAKVEAAKAQQMTEQNAAIADKDREIEGNQQILRMRSRMAWRSCHEELLVATKSRQELRIARVKTKIAWRSCLKFILLVALLLLGNMVWLSCHAGVFLAAKARQQLRCRGLGGAVCSQGPAKEGGVAGQGVCGGERRKEEKEEDDKREKEKEKKDEEEQEEERERGAAARDGTVVREVRTGGAYCLPYCMFRTGGRRGRGDIATVKSGYLSSNACVRKLSACKRNELPPCDRPVD